MSKKKGNNAFGMREKKFVGDGMYSFIVDGRKGGDFSEPMVDAEFHYFDQDGNKFSFWIYQNGTNPDSAAKSLRDINDLVDALCRFSIEYAKAHNKAFINPTKETHNAQQAKGKTPQVKSR